jgi:hypothetical protein
MNDYSDEVCTLLGLIKSKGAAGLDIDDIPSDLETAIRIAEGQKLVFRKSVNNEPLDKIGREDAPESGEVINERTGEIETHYGEDDEWIPSPEHLFLAPDGELALKNHLAARKAGPKEPRSV